MRTPTGDAFGEAPVKDREDIITALMGMGLLTMRHLEARSYDMHSEGTGPRAPTQNT